MNTSIGEPPEPAHEDALPWWKNKIAANVLIPAIIAGYAMLMGLLVAVLVYSLTREDQNFAELRREVVDLRVEMAVARNENLHNREEIANIEPRLRHLETEFVGIKANQ